MARILIADDDADFVEQMRLALERAGHQVRACHDGKETLAHLATSAVDVLVLDMRMSYTLDGLDALRQIRMRAAPEGMTIIVVSALDGPVDEIQEQAAALGAAVWLRKPVALADILAYVPQSPGG